MHNFIAVGKKPTKALVEPLFKIAVAIVDDRCRRLHTHDYE
jgi:uncharacterized protein (UPF0218 family)